MKRGKVLNFLKKYKKKNVKTKQKKKQHSILFQQYRNHWKKVLFWVISNVITITFISSIPFVITLITADVLEYVTGDVNNINSMSIYITLSSYSIGICLYIVFDTYLLKMSQILNLEIVKNIRFLMMERNLSLSNKQADAENIDAEVGKIVFDVESATSWLRSVTQSILSLSISLIIAIIFAYQLSPFLALGLFVLIIIYMIVLRPFEKRVFKKLAISKESKSRFVKNIYFDTFKRSEVKVQDSKMFEMKKFDTANTESIEKQIDFVKSKQSSWIWTKLIAQTIRFVPFLVGIVLIISSSSSSEEAINLLPIIIGTSAATSTISGHIYTIESMVHKVSLSISSSKRIDSFFKLKIEKNKGKITPGRLDGDIVFKNVTFKYNDRTILKKFNLTIKSNEKVALIGGSGLGKSTILKLLLRFYKIDSGDITIGGTSIYDFDLPLYRRELGYLQQNPVIFKGTIRENILYNLSKHNAIDSAQKAHLLEDIKHFKGEFDYKLDDSGTTLSGGQKQRIAIARLFASTFSIVLLDEATSALDPSAEKNIKQSLEGLTRDKTTIIVAHRLSTIKEVDRIVVLGKEGKILEQGKHKKLFEKKGYYYNLNL